MKLLMNGDQELATIDLDIDASTGTMNPKVDSLGYRIEGPVSRAALVEDKAIGGLRLNMDLSDIVQVSVVIEKEDVKKIKGLMNKDAIKFMVKALM